MTPSEPRNPFYLLLLLVSLIFVVNALAVALLPVLEQKALEAGQEPPPSPFRDWLRGDGSMWLLYEVVAMIVLGILSMGLDLLRRLKKERAAAKIAPAYDSSTPGP